jgi:hypothetical protein
MMFPRNIWISYPSIILTSEAVASFICFAQLTPCQLAKESNRWYRGQERKLRDRGVSSERPRRPVKYWLSTPWKGRLEDVSRLLGQRGNRRQTIRGALQF